MSIADMNLAGGIVPIAVGSPGLAFTDAMLSRDGCRAASAI